MASFEQAELASNAPLLLPHCCMLGCCGPLFYRGSALAAQSLLTLCLFVVSAAVVRLAARGQCQSCSSFPYQSDWFGSLVPSTLMGLVNWFCVAVDLVFCALLSLLLTHQAEVSELN